MPAIGPRSEWLPRHYMSHFLTNKSIFYRGDPMANRKNSHRRRVRVAVLMVLCGAVFAAFFARLAWMQFVRADYYADKAAEASSASYTVTQHAARGAIVDSAGVVLARDTTVYDRPARHRKSHREPDRQQGCGNTACCLFCCRVGGGAARDAGRRQ